MMPLQHVDNALSLCKRRANWWSISLCPTEILKYWPNFTGSNLCSSMNSSICSFVFFLFFFIFLLKPGWRRRCFVLSFIVWFRSVPKSFLNDENIQRKMKKKYLIRPCSWATRSDWLSQLTVCSLWWKTYFWINWLWTTFKGTFKHLSPTYMHPLM